MVMGRCRISGSKYLFFVTKLLLKVSFSCTFLSIMFYSFNILYKIGMFRFGEGIKDLTFIYKMIIHMSYVFSL